MGLDINKVFLPLAGRSVLRRSLDALEESGSIGGIVLVLAEGEREHYDALIGREGECALVRHVVTGADTRQQSVYAGLRVVPEDVRLVAIHDAARALVPPDVITSVVESARQYGTGVAATLITDTVKRVDDSDCAVETLVREQLRAVQTPQVFLRSLIMRAHERAQQDAYQATDDAALVERYGEVVRLVVAPQGNRNVKLTSPEDVEVMEQMIGGNMRIGQGLDAHRLVPGRKLILGGVQVPHETGLLGHSDADVATHALIDALLGAAAMGDIGTLYPDHDPQYAGISSIALLKDVASRLTSAGLGVVNCDVTIVAQRPRLAPYIGEMRMNFARALGIALPAINVKATTSEHMGYEGREEGISASAVVLLTGRSTNGG